MTEIANSDLGFLVATLPVGIAYVHSREVWTILEDAKSRHPFLTAARHDQRLICALINAGAITAANQTATRMFEVDAGNAQGLPTETKLPKGAETAFVDGLFHIFEGKGAFSAGATIRLKNGDKQHVHLSIWPSDGGAPPALIGIAVTNVQAGSVAGDAREDLRGALAHAARISMLGEMTASIAHEVNQPLSSIVTNAEAGLRWLNREPPDLVEVKTILERIVRSGNRAADVVTAMRSLARNAEPQRSAVCLNTLIGEASQLLRSELTKRQVALKLELAADSPETLIDRTQILQVVVNLALNAAQAMADGQAWNRTLVIRTRFDRGSVAVVEVEDSGPGVDPAARERLFETFYTTKESGVGLGLGICRSIVEAHGSVIELESSAHLGARFSFRLPLSAIS
jgi:signal transduction histidine kinase